MYDDSENSDSSEWLVVCKCGKERDIHRTKSCKFCSIHTCRKCRDYNKYYHRCAQCKIKICKDCAKSCNICGKYFFCPSCYNCYTECPYGHHDGKQNCQCNTDICKYAQDYEDKLKKN